MERQYINTIKSELRKRGLLWLPFLALITLVLAFEIIPGFYIFLSSFSSEKGFTLANYLTVFTKKFYLLSLTNSLAVSLYSAAFGLFIGTYAAFCLKTLGGEIPEKLITVINITTNFSGVPLAFAFIILLGSNGLFTILLKNKLNLDIYSHGFNLFSWSGITLTYIYFEIPLAIMLMYPAIYGIKDDIKEAAMTLGASNFTFWLKIGIPTLMPSLLGSFCILFANSLGAYATAYALVNANKNLLSITIANLVSGDIITDPSLASALATIMGGILMLMIFVNNFRRRKC
ncbi:ABC transporter permease subunit [Clostridium sp. DJ247]|uniref:ABC transporter permease n=1 Tax=Clostridium sp. DJ247 TaxID=2726188 RepID=UPI0016248982|nr:ABC transporter permease subunit [Clostridium sp. DJ247]MBC2579440.1 ABC transporter permease subunit [Clostridium sp. DJ247]